MSILLIEASSKPKKDGEVRMLKLADGTQVPAPIKRTFRFAKPNFKETFDEGDFLYVTLVSQNGGTIRLKVNFPSSPGGFGDTMNTNEETKASKRKRDLGKETQTPTSVEGELQAWFKENMHMLDRVPRVPRTAVFDSAFFRVVRNPPPALLHLLSHGKRSGDNGGDLGSDPDRTLGGSARRARSLPLRTLDKRRFRASTRQRASGSTSEAERELEPVTKPLPGLLQGQARGGGARAGPRVRWNAVHYRDVSGTTAVVLFVRNTF